MTRADRALMERGMVRSRAEAQRLIMAGQVFANGTAIAKASVPIAPHTPLEVVGERMRFVSRGGLKLESAIDAFGIAIAGRTALDVGASTGGFTDCLLQRDAARVTAVDAGHGQMDASIAAHPRVDAREGINARHLTPADFPAPFDIIVVDVAFISLTLILPVLAPLIKPDGDLIALVKPQFEVGRDRLGKGGIVRSAAERDAALQRVILAAEAAGLAKRGIVPSPILGGDGNAEFLLWTRPVHRPQGY